MDVSTGVGTPLSVVVCILTSCGCMRSSGKEAVSTETDWLTRTTVLWRNWNITCPEANYLNLG